MTLKFDVEVRLRLYFSFSSIHSDGSSCTHHKVVFYNIGHNHNESFLFCGSYSSFFMFSISKNVLIEQHLAWYSCGNLSLYFAVMDRNLISTQQVSQNARLSFQPEQKQISFLVQENILKMDLFVQVEKYLQLELLVPTGTTQKCTVFDGPGQLSPQLNSREEENRYKPSTFLCFMTMYLLGTKNSHFTAINYTGFTQNDSQVVLSLNRHNATFYDSSAFHNYRILDISALDGFQIYITFVAYNYWAKSLAETCVQGGMSAFNNKGKLYQHAQTFCKLSTIERAKKRLYSKNPSLRLVLYSYNLYSVVNATLRILQTRCIVIILDLCHMNQIEDVQHYLQTQIGNRSVTLDNKFTYSQHWWNYGYAPAVSFQVEHSECGVLVLNQYSHVQFNQTERHDECNTTMILSKLSHHEKRISATLVGLLFPESVIEFSTLFSTPDTIPCESFAADKDYCFVPVRVGKAPTNAFIEMHTLPQEANIKPSSLFSLCVRGEWRSSWMEITLLPSNTTKQSNSLTSRICLSKSISWSSLRTQECNPVLYLHVFDLLDFILLVRSPDPISNSTAFKARVITHGKVKTSLGYVVQAPKEKCKQRCFDKLAPRYTRDTEWEAGERCANDCRQCIGVTNLSSATVSSSVLGETFDQSLTLYPLMEVSWWEATMHLTPAWPQQHISRPGIMDYAFIWLLDGQTSNLEIELLDAMYHGNARKFYDNQIDDLKLHKGRNQDFLPLPVNKYNCHTYTSRNGDITYVLLEQKNFDQEKLSRTKWEHICAHLGGSLPILRSKQDEEVFVSLIKLAEELLFMEAVFIGLADTGTSHSSDNKARSLFLDTLG